MTRRRGRPSLTAAEVEAQKDRIAKVAERLFRQDGYAAISMRRLAQEAGCAPMTLYAYFPSKAAILQTIWASFFEELFADLEREAAAADPRAALAAVCHAYAAYWIGHPDRYVMVYMTEGVSPEEVGAFVEGSGAAQRHQLFPRLIAAADPSLGEQEVKALGEVVVSALQGIAYNHITTSAYPWESARVLVDTLVRRLV